MKGTLQQEGNWRRVLEPVNIINGAVLSPVYFSWHYAEIKHHQEVTVKNHHLYGHTVLNLTFVFLLIASKKYLL